MTERDVAVVTEIALHGVLSRDQTIDMGFFGSLPRANARLGPLVRAGLIARVQLEPALALRQSLYYARKAACTFLDPRVGALLKGRKNTPRFIEHALAVADVRIALKRLDADKWFHECQIRHRYTVAGHTEDFRPDGLAVIGGSYVFVEVDRGHVSIARLREKLRGYERYANLGLFRLTYRHESFHLLFATVGNRRKGTIERLISAYPLSASVVTLHQLSVAQNLGEVLR